MKVYHGVTVEGKGVEVSVEGEKIKKIKSIPVTNKLPLLAIPLVDCQNNGALGYGFNRCSEHINKIKDMTNFYRSHGVNKVLLTTTTCPPEQLIKSGKALTELFENDQEANDFFPGVFHEGIFMSKQDGWRGAHSIKFVLDPDYALFKKINKAFNNRIVLVNVAPEEPGGMKFIEKAVADGIRVSIGHACPNADQVAEAVKRGATMVTHFGNGASPTIHRHRNPFWSFLAHDELELGIIADGHHLPNDLIQTAIKVKGTKKLNFVSDCAGLSGKPPGDYGNVVLREDGYLHMKGQEILAGAYFQLDRGVELLCEMGWDLKDAWKQCSEIPAKNFNIKVNSIKVGQVADFVLSKYSPKNGLVIQTILHKGKEHPVLPIRPVFN